MTEVPNTKTLDQMRSEIRKSYYIPDNYRIPVGRNRKNYLRAYQEKYFKWRFRLIENRRVKMEKLALQLYNFNNALERFVRYDEWCERQMRQYQDLCAVVGNGVDEEDCPDEYDIEEILHNRMVGAQERLKRHKEDYPTLSRTGTPEQKRWREYLENVESDHETEYHKWMGGKRFLFVPAEERRTDRVLKRNDNVMDMLIKEVQYDSGLLNKTLLPDRVNVMFQRYGNRHQQFKSPLQQVLVFTPVLDPTLDEMEVNNGKHLDRMRMLDEMRQVEGATVGDTDMSGVVVEDTTQY